jgi:NitT/TauT family transport system permease protein
MKGRRLAAKALSVAAILALWAGLASFFPPSMLPGPRVVGGRLVALALTGELAHHMTATVSRVLVGFTIAFVLSLGIGMLMGLRRPAEALLESWVLVGLTIPGLCWAVLAVMWFGISEAAPVFSIAVVVLPMLTLNMWQGTKSIDRELMEMGHVFGAPGALMLRHVVLPQLLPFCLAGARLGFALGWKVVVLSELFGLSSGVGYMINRGFSTYSMDDVLAWTAGFTIVMFSVEYLVFLPVERRLLRWRPALAG